MNGCERGYIFQDRAAPNAMWLGIDRASNCKERGEHNVIWDTSCCATGRSVSCIYKHYGWGIEAGSSYPRNWIVTILESRMDLFPHLLGVLNDKDGEEIRLS